jgi:hypothetical protein
MAAPLPGWMVAALVVLTVVAGVGLAAAYRRPMADERPTAANRDLSSVVRRQRFLHILALSLTLLLTLALHVFYNLTFVQHQGRYLYPALIPIAVGFVAGLGYWLRPLMVRWPRAVYLLPLGIAALLGGISLFALWRVLPGLAPG